MATGTTLRAAWVSGTSSSAARRQQALISAPVQELSSGRGWLGGMLKCPWYIAQMASFSLALGRSRKKTASNRSALANSGGSLLMSKFARAERFDAVFFLDLPNA